MLQHQKPLRSTSTRKSNTRPASVRCTAQGTNGGSQQSHQQQQVDRRAVLSCITSACVLSLQGPAAAEVDLRKTVANNFLDWWKSRRTQNGGAKLLNPIYVAKQRLQQASELLGNGSVN